MTGDGKGNPAGFSAGKKDLFEVLLTLHPEPPAPV